MSRFHQQRTTRSSSSYETKSSSNFQAKPQPKPSFFSNQPAVYQPAARPAPQPVPVQYYEPDEQYVTVTEDQIMNFLERYDENRDGFLNKCELTRAFEDLGAFFPEWRVGRALCVADKDGDGHVGLDELEDVLLYAKKSGYKIEC